MSLSIGSIRRPIFTLMATLIVIILGLISLWRLPIDLMPDISYPTISVSTQYENASPEEIEQLVTRPIEEAMSAVPGVEEVSSTSSEGVSNVRLSFTWGTDLDAASNDVRDRLDRVVGRLPEDASRPLLRKFDLAAFPILILGASSNLDPVEARRLIEEQVKYRIERVPGVAALDIWGGLEREIHVNLLPEKVKALGLSLDQILARIRAGNVNVPAGTIYRGNFEVTIRTPGEYVDLEQLRNAVIAERAGANVHLRDVASVEDSWQRVRQIVRVNGRPGIRLSVSKQSGKNTVEVARAALHEIDHINEELPQLRIIPIIDTSDYIKRSISNVGSSALYGGLLAVVVLLVFLRNVRSTAIIAAAIPISIIATFALMYFSGYTLNLMTLGGLALGVGMLVDNAIVVLENIFRLREGGLKAREAAVQGVGEVTGAVLASTLTTVVVFLPMVFVRGMAGVMFKQLAIVISFALLASLASAMTLVPMLASHVPDGAGGEAKGLGPRVFRLSARLFTAMERDYQGLLRWALGHRALVVVGALGLLAGSLALIPMIGTEFIPQSDEGEVRVTAEMAAGTRLDLLDRNARTIEAIVQEAVPETKSVVVNIGGGGFRGGAQTVEMRIALKPQSERERSSDEVAADLRRRLSGIPGAVLRVRPGSGLFILNLGRGGGDRVQVELRGYDLLAADELASNVKRLVEDVPGVTDARISRDIGSPEDLIIVDRAKAADLKVTVQQVANLLQTALSGTHASNFREAGDEFVIRVQLKDAERMSLPDILDLTLANAEGQPVVLKNLVRVEPRTGPVFIERADQERVVTVSANVAGRDMGSVVRDVRKRLEQVPVPRGFAIVFGGEFEEQEKAFRELLLSIILALVLVYMVMAAQFESLLDPLVVMFTVPLAAIGVCLMLFLTGTTFNVQSYIGCIMLGGIVVNNAIVLVDHTNLLRRRDGMALSAAIEEAGRRRLRPILMTSLTTILGLLPLALGLGEGGEAQAPLARAVIGGLASASLITLLVVPVIYSLFERRSPRREAPAVGT